MDASTVSSPETLAVDNARLKDVCDRFGVVELSLCGVTYQPWFRS